MQLINRSKLPYLFMALLTVFLSCSKNEKVPQLITDAPGTYIADKPMDLKLYFDSLQQAGLGCIDVHNAESKGIELVEHSILELQHYATGQRQSYPIEEVNKALGEMAFQQGYLYSHGADSLNPGQTFFFRYLEQAARLCPDLTFISDATTPDGNAGILYFPEWSQINPLYAFLLFRNSEKGFNVQLIGAIGEHKIDKILPLTDEQGRSYYLCSYHPNAVYFGQFVYQIKNNRAHLLCSYPQQKANGPDWLTPDTDNYEIVFNPKELSWKYCSKQEDTCHQLDNTRVLYLKLDGEASCFYVK